MISNALETMITEIVIKEVKKTFEETAMKEIDRLEATLIERIKLRVEECRNEARVSAQKMTVEILNMPSLDGIEIRLKI